MFYNLKNQLTKAHFCVQPVKIDAFGVLYLIIGRFILFQNYVVKLIRDKKAVFCYDYNK